MMSDPLILDKKAQDLLFRDARTANTFTDEPVTDEQMRAIHDLVQAVPTTFLVDPHARDNFARMPMEARESAADLNASLQIAYLIMGVRAAGLAAGALPGFDAYCVRTDFFCKGSKQKPIVVMNIGVP